MSQFKVQNLMSKIEFHIKMSQFRVKSRFKESNCADEGHSLNRDFTVFQNRVLDAEISPHRGLQFLDISSEQRQEQFYSCFRP